MPLSHPPASPPSPHTQSLSRPTPAAHRRHHIFRLTHHHPPPPSPHLPPHSPPPSPTQVSAAQHTTAQHSAA
eukprot:5558091-Prymnesium_polylepis.1